MKRFRNSRIVFLIFAFLLLYGCKDTANIPDVNEPQSKCSTFDHLPKNQLEIDHGFIELIQPTYENNKVKFSVELNGIGMQYMETGLFQTDYKIDFELRHTKTQEVYVQENEMLWNLKELKYDVSTELEKSGAFEKNLNEEEVSYHISISSAKDGFNVSTFAGILTIQ